MVSRRRGAVLALLAVVVVAGYGYVVAGTNPFTTGADALTAVVFGLAGLVLVRTVLRRHAGAAAPVASPRPVFLPWLLVLSTFCTWELVTYVAGFSGGRHAYPTISSLLDAASRWRGAKVAMFVVWTALGWGVVRG